MKSLLAIGTLLALLFGYNLLLSQTGRGEVKYFKDFDFLKFTPLGEITDTSGASLFVLVRYKGHDIHAIELQYRGEIIDRKRLHYLGKTPFEAYPISFTDDLFVHYRFYLPGSIWSLDVRFVSNQKPAKRGAFAKIDFINFRFSRTKFRAHAANAWLDTKGGSSLYWNPTAAAPQDLESILRLAKNFHHSHSKEVMSQVTHADSQFVWLEKVELEAKADSTLGIGQVEEKGPFHSCFRRATPWKKYFDVISYLHPGLEPCDCPDASPKQR